MSFIDFVMLQLMRLNAKGQLGVGERCVNADTQGVKLVFCKLGTVDGPWEYDEVNINSFNMFYVFLGGVAYCFLTFNITLNLDSHYFCVHYVLCHTRENIK